MLSLLTTTLVLGSMIWVMSFYMKRELVRPCHPNNYRQFLTNANFMMPVFVYSLVACLRWNVGSDCLSYMRGFYVPVEDKMEIGFEALQDFWRVVGGSHIPFFFCLGIIQMALIYYALRKSPGALMFYPLFLVLSDQYWNYNGAVRQTIAFAVFVYVVVQTMNKKYYAVLILVMIATLFHRSSWTMIPLLLFFLSLKIITLVSLFN